MGQLLLQPQPPTSNPTDAPDIVTPGSWVFLSSRYLEVRAKRVEKSFACAIIVITELERMSCVCSKNLSKENRNLIYFQPETSQKKDFLKYFSTILF